MNAVWLVLGVLLIVAGTAMWWGIRHPPRQWYERK